MLIPLTYYRPERAPDGEGGYTETMGDGQTVYGALEVHETRVTATVRASGPLQVADILEAGGACYEVVGFTEAGRSGYRAALLEKRDRPVHT